MNKALRSDRARAELGLSDKAAVQRCLSFERPAVALRRSQPALDFLYAGFGWRRMPEHLVAAPLADGTLVALRIENDSTCHDGLTIYAALRQDRALGSASHLLLDAL